MKVQWLTLIGSVIVSWCVATCCNAQDVPQTITETPTATVTQRIVQGATVSFVVNVCVEGKCVEGRWLPPETMRELLKAKAERESLAAQVKALQEQVTLLEQIKAGDEKIMANLSAEIEQKEKHLTATNDQLFKAIDLIADYQRLAKTGKFVAALNSPYVKLGTTMAVIAASVLAR